MDRDSVKSIAKKVALSPLSWALGSMLFVPRSFRSGKALYNKHVTPVAMEYGLARNVDPRVIKQITDKYSNFMGGASAVSTVLGAASIPSIISGAKRILDRRNA
jgi:hypothetical protein